MMQDNMRPKQKLIFPLAPNPSSCSSHLEGITLHILWPAALSFVLCSPSLVPRWLRGGPARDARADNCHDFLLKQYYFLIRRGSPSKSLHEGSTWLLRVGGSGGPVSGDWFDVPGHQEVHCARSWVGFAGEVRGGKKARLVNGCVIWDWFWVKGWAGKNVRAVVLRLFCIMKFYYSNFWFISSGHKLIFWLK